MENLITDFNNVFYPTRDINTQVNGTSHFIGTYSTSTQYFDGCYRGNFIDGLQLDLPILVPSIQPQDNGYQKNTIAEYGSNWLLS